MPKSNQAEKTTPTLKDASVVKMKPEATEETAASETPEVTEETVTSKLSYDVATLIYQTQNAKKLDDQARVNRTEAGGTRFMVMVEIAVATPEETAAYLAGVLLLEEKTNSDFANRIANPDNIGCRNLQAIDFGDAETREQRVAVLKDRKVSDEDDRKIRGVTTLLAHICPPTDNAKIRANGRLLQKVAKLTTAEKEAAEKWVKAEAKKATADNGVRITEGSIAGGHFEKPPQGYFDK